MIVTELTQGVGRAMFPGEGPRDFQRLPRLPGSLPVDSVSHFIALTLLPSSHLTLLSPSFVYKDLVIMLGLPR